MDGHRFDTLTRRLAVTVSRRGLLRGVLGGAAASALGFLGVRDAAARTCTGPGTICRENANCCSGICARGAGERRLTCQCPSATVACRDQCVDPSSFLSDPNNCGSCRTRCPSTQCQTGVCNSGICGLTPNEAAIGNPCHDDLCTTDSTCQDDGACGNGTPVDCTSQSLCLQDGTCDPNTGACVNLPVEDETPCDDESICLVNAACSEGVCVGGTICAPPDMCHLAGTCSDGVCGNYPNADEGTSCTYDGNLNGSCCSGACVQCCDDGDCTSPATCGGSGTPNVCGTESGACFNDGQPCTAQSLESTECCSGACCDNDGTLTCCTFDPTCVPDGGLCSGGAESCCNGACCDVDGSLLCCTPGSCIEAGQPCPGDETECCSGACCEDDNGRQVCCEGGSCAEDGQPCTVQGFDNPECCSTVCCDNEGTLICCTV